MWVQSYVQVSILTLQVSCFCWMVVLIILVKESYSQSDEERKLEVFVHPCWESGFLGELHAPASKLYENGTFLRD